MKPFLIVYATREGQTQQIAEHIAVLLRDRGARVRVVDASNAGPALDLLEFGLVVLAASVHLQKHDTRYCIGRWWRTPGRASISKKSR